MYPCTSAADFVSKFEELRSESHCVEAVGDIILKWVHIRVMRSTFVDAIVVGREGTRKKGGGEGRRKRYMEGRGRKNKEGRGEMKVIALLVSYRNILPPCSVVVCLPTLITVLTCSQLNTLSTQRSRNHRSTTSCRQVSVVLQYVLQYVLLCCSMCCSMCCCVAVCVAVCACVVVYVAVCL